MNLMRGAKLVFVLGVLCSLLMSCEERPRIYTREDFIGRTLELATFLTDNYAIKESTNWDRNVKDSLSFMTEEKNLITFYVLYNSIMENIFYSAWEEGDPFDTIHDGFNLKTRLMTKDLEQFFDIDIHHGPRIEWRKDYWTDTYARLSSTNGKFGYDIETETYAPYEWKETEDTIFITYANMTCTLKKNVGIVKFTCDEHSWELVQ